MPLKNRGRKIVTAFIINNLKIYTWQTMKIRNIKKEK